MPLLYIACKTKCFGLEFKIYLEPAKLKILAWSSRFILSLPNYAKGSLNNGFTSSWQRGERYFLTKVTHKNKSTNAQLP